MRAACSWIIHRCCGRFYVASPRAVQTMMNEENQPLIKTGRKSVVPTSTGSHTLHKTVYALIYSEDTKEIEEAYAFLRKLWALLLFQFSAILFIASPFTFLDPVKDIVGSNNEIFEMITCLGIFLSFVLALTKGTVYPNAHISMISLTIFVGLEMGLSFSQKSWGTNALLAIGQATSGFAMILGMLQFEVSWFTYPMAGGICFLMGCLWTLVQVETGVTWKVAAIVSFLGWLFTLQVLFCCHHITKHVAPDEYILGTLFILAPEALVCLNSKKRHPDEEDSDKDQYGGIITSP